MRINCKLSGRSFREAAKAIHEYNVEQRVQEFCRQLAEEGYKATYAILQMHVYSGQTIGSIQLIEEHNAAKVVVSSDAILFLEFGSGLLGLGTAPHANDYDTAYGSGTYPGKGHWDDPNGWHYIGDDGKLHWSQGMVASMPMYTGGSAMRLKLAEVARKVFHD